MIHKPGSLSSQQDKHFPVCVLIITILPVTIKCTINKVVKKGTLCALWEANWPCQMQYFLSLTELVDG